MSGFRQGLTPQEQSYLDGKYVIKVSPSGDTTGAKDAAALQAAIDAIPTSGGTVRLAEGTWYVATALIAKDGLTFAGAGKQATTIKAVGSVALFDESVSGLSDVHVVDFTWDASAVTSINISGVYFTGGTRIRVRRVQTIDTISAGIVVLNSTDSLVAGCDVENALNGQPVDTSGGTAAILAQGTRVRVVNNRVDTANTAGICLGNAGSIDSLVMGNTVHAAAFIGIATGSGSQQCSIADNIVTNSGDNGIDLSDTLTGSVTGNIIDGIAAGKAGIGSGWDALSGTPLALVTISGNVITNAPNGINLTGPTGTAVGLTVTGNTVNAPTASGISLHDIAHSVVTGNVIYEPGSGAQGILLGGPGATSANIIQGNKVVDLRSPAIAIGISFGGGGAYAGAGNLVVDNELSTCATPIQNAPAATDVLRDNAGYNPVGAVTVAVPATGVAVAAAPYDRTFYVTAGASTCTMTIQDGAAPVIPSAGFGTVRVPAGHTVTPAFTAAPTWVVEGE